MAQSHREVTLWASQVLQTQPRWPKGWHHPAERQSSKRRASQVQLWPPAMAKPGSEVGGWGEAPGLASGCTAKALSPMVGKGGPETVATTMRPSVCPIC